MRVFIIVINKYVFCIYMFVYENNVKIVTVINMLSMLKSCFWLKHDHVGTSVRCQ